MRGQARGTLTMMGAHFYVYFLWKQGVLGRD